MGKKGFALETDFQYEKIALMWRWSAGKVRFGRDGGGLAAVGVIESC